MLDTVIWVLGVLVLVRLAYKVGRFVYKYALRPAADLRPYGAKSGGWAVVTGASDGIGKSFAFELAKRGFNLLLISRTKSKLDEVAEALRSKYKVQTDVLAVDFTSADISFYEDIRAAISKLDRVGVLVNNVGINYEFPTSFLEGTPKLTDDIVNVNISGVNRMTHIVLPKMVERKSGAIINVGSFSGVIPAPMLSTYSATKAYVDFFSWCLSTEYKDKGIAVQGITPGITVSNMSKVRKPNVFAGIADPAAVAKGSLDTLGQEVRWCPFWGHALIESVFKRLPTDLSCKIIYNLNSSTSKKALAKHER